MKAIVANLILGSLTCATFSNLPAWADTLPRDRNTAEIPEILSAKALIDRSDFVLPPAFIFEPQNFNYSISLENKEYIKNILQQNYWQLDRNRDNSNLAIDLANQKIASFKKSPYLGSEERENLILGKHNNFWHHEDGQKYWGVTTVKTWGDGRAENVSLKKLNYINAAPILAPGTSALTISGGSQKNRIGQNILLGDVADFQGGVAYHQSLANEVTLGLGLVYEDLLLGFSQLTYQPKNIPLRTTVSLLQGEKGIEVYSHLKIQPSDEIIFNLYSEDEKQKFDFNWGLVSGLTLIADGNSETESLRAGAKLVYKNELISFAAKAQLDNNDRLQWQVDSQLGDFRLKYSTDRAKTKTEVAYDFDPINDAFFQCSFFFNNQTHLRRKGEDRLAVWGWNIHSTDKVAKNRYYWQFSLGYGVGSEGEGAIASMETAINSSVSLKLSYDAISLTSEDTQIKLQLSSN